MLKGIELLSLTLFFRSVLYVSKTFAAGARPAVVGVRRNDLLSAGAAANLVG